MLKKHKKSDIIAYIIVGLIVLVSIIIGIIYIVSAIHLDKVHNATIPDYYNDKTLTCEEYNITICKADDICFKGKITNNNVEYDISIYYSYPSYSFYIQNSEDINKVESFSAFVSERANDFKFEKNKLTITITNYSFTQDFYGYKESDTIDLIFTVE